MEGLEFLQNITVWDVLLFLFAIDKVFDILKKRIPKANGKNSKYEYLKIRIKTLENQNTQFNIQIMELTKLIKIANTGSRSQIKIIIIDKYNYFMQRGWIDSYSLDCIERLYDSYTQLGGNTYISEIMKKLRALPNTDK